MINNVEFVGRVQSFLEPGFTLEEIRLCNDTWVVTVRFRCPLTDITLTRSMHMTIQDIFYINGEKKGDYSTEIILKKAALDLVEDIRSDYVQEMGIRLKRRGIEPAVLVQDNCKGDRSLKAVMAYRKLFNQLCRIHVNSLEEMRGYRNKYMCTIEEHGVPKPNVWEIFKRIWRQV